MNTLAAVMAAHEMGFTCIPCDGKVPRVRWKQYQTVKPTLQHYLSWFRDGCNVALLTGGMVLVDIDDPELLDFVIGKMGPTSHMLRTPRAGIHLGFRKRKGVEVKNLVKVKGMPIDIRTDGGIEIIPPSKTERGSYEWLGELRPVSELPVAKIGWTRERVRKVVTTPVVVTDRYAEAALRGEARKVAEAKEGSRNDALNRAAFSLGTLVATGTLSREAAETVLTDAALSAGLGEHEAAATIKSGMDAGIKRPRTLGDKT